MRQRATLRELLIGVQGLALLRNFHDGPDDGPAERLEDIRRLLDDSEFGTTYTVREIEVAAGYRSWSQRYDEPGNPLIKLEEPAVRARVRGWSTAIAELQSL